MAKDPVGIKPQLKPFTIYYFQAETKNGALQDTTLQQALSSSLKVKIDTTNVASSWQNRVWEPGTNDSYLIDIYHDDPDCFFGDLGLFSRGHMQALIDTGDTATQFANVAQRPSPKGMEYLRSMMYWMVIDNHVLAIQSLALNANRLGQYLTWLLSQQTAILATDTVVSLNSSLNTDDIGGLDEITGLVIGGADEVMPATMPPTLDGKSVAENKSKQLKGWGERAQRVLRAIVQEPTEADEIIEAASETGSLQVFVDVRYRRRKKGMSADNDLAARLCQVLPEGQFRARGKHGRISQGDIRLHYPAKIRMNVSLPDIEDVRAKLNDAYIHFIQKGKIEK